jgi:hypothetical protein
MIMVSLSSYFRAYPSRFRLTGWHSRQGMPGVPFPVGRCTLLMNHHVVSQPSTASRFLAFVSQCLSGSCCSQSGVVRMLRSNGSWGTCIPQGVTTFLHHASRRTFCSGYARKSITSHNRPKNNVLLVRSFMPIATKVHSELIRCPKKVLRSHTQNPLILQA